MSKIKKTTLNLCLFLLPCINYAIHFLNISYMCFIKIILHSNLPTDFRVFNEPL